MGTSNWQNISYCIDIIRKINPASVLDIGTGFGRWGIICREFLEVWNGKVNRKDWKIIIDGVEIFKENIDEYHKYFYNTILNIDAYDYLKELNKKYDLIILGDVLEHFEKEKAEQVLKMCINKSKYTMLNVPIGEQWEQHALYENKYEEHKSVWDEQYFNKYQIVRKFKFRDYINREFVTYIFSSNNIIDDKLRNIDVMLDEKEKFSKYSSNINDYLFHLGNLIAKSEYELRDLILSEEEKIMRADINEKYIIKLEVSNDKNEKSNGFETWIYGISSDDIKVIDLKKINRNGNCMIKKDNQSTTGEVFIFTQPNSVGEFEIIGNTMKIKCLNHPWSGMLNIYINGKNLLTVDLYNKENRIVDVIIDLRGVSKE